MSVAGAPALVLLHAFGSEGAAFEAVSARLGDRRPTLAPDLPGFGGEPGLADPCVAAYADWVEARVREAGLQRATVGGWSMGGKIALALAARRPPWLTGLALIAPSPPLPEPMEEDARREQLDGLGDRVLAERSVRELLVAETPPRRVEAAVRSRLAVNAGAWRWWLESGSREDVTSAAPLATPALLVVGADDSNLGEDVQRRLTLPSLADARLERIERCGHFLPLEAPERLGRLLEGWIAGLSG